MNQGLPRNGRAAAAIGRDGTLRDLAGLRGGYHPVAETDFALTLTMTGLQRLQPARVEWLLDAPVSNSGRLCSRIREVSEGQPWETDAHVVPDPDRSLARKTGVVSSDSTVLDRCVSWLNLAPWLLGEFVPEARIVDVFAVE